MGSSRDDSSFGQGTVLELRDAMQLQLNFMKKEEIDIMYKDLEQ